MNPNSDHSDFASMRGVTLRLLWACNLRCIMCDHPYKPHSEMSVETAYAVMDQLTHPVRLSFIGGEPCLWLIKRQEVMRRALQDGHVVHMTTNGMLLSQMTDFVDAFRDRRVSVLFSIDGFEKSYERIRPRSDWNTLVESIRLINSRRRQGGNTSAPIMVNTVLMRSNLDELPALINFCAQEGVDVITLSYGIIYDSMVKRGQITESESVFFCKEETDRAVAAAIDVALRLGITLNAPAPLCNPNVQGGRTIGKPVGIGAPGSSPLPNGGAVPCRNPWREIWVNQDGSVQPCCCGGIGPTIGHVNDGLANVWNSAMMLDVRSHLARNEFHEDCRCGANMFGVYRRSGPEHFFTRIRQQKIQGESRPIELPMYQG